MKIKSYLPKKKMTLGEIFVHVLEEDYKKNGPIFREELDASKEVPPEK